MNNKVAFGLVALIVIGIAVGFFWLKDYNNRQPVVNVIDVDSTGLVEAQKAGAKLLDVRTKEEYVEGHIPGAELVAEGTYESVLADAPRDDAYIIYCRTGNRSTAVVNWMKDNGFTRIYHLVDGIVEWRGGFIVGEEPGAPDYTMPWLGENQFDQGPSDVSDIPILAPIDERAVMVQFSTTSCPACIQSKSTVQAISKEYKDVLDVRVFNVDENAEAAEAFQLLKGFSVPHFFFIDNQGHVSGSTLGFSSERELRNAVDGFLAAID